MRFCIVGSGAVGGYYGAKLAHAGCDVTFLARGAHLAAIRERGLTIKSRRSELQDCRIAELQKVMEGRSEGHKVRRSQGQKVTRPEGLKAEGLKA
jgi:ketopantoate reductase